MNFEQNVNTLIYTQLKGNLFVLKMTKNTPEVYSHIKIAENALQGLKNAEFRKVCTLEPTKYLNVFCGCVNNQSKVYIVHTNKRLNIAELSIIEGLHIKEKEELILLANNYLDYAKQQ